MKKRIEELTDLIKEVFRNKSTIMLDWVVDDIGYFTHIGTISYLHLQKENNEMFLDFITFVEQDSNMSITVKVNDIIHISVIEDDLLYKIKNHYNNKNLVVLEALVNGNLHTKEGYIKELIRIDDEIVGVYFEEKDESAPILFPLIYIRNIYLSNKETKLSLSRQAKIRLAYKENKLVRVRVINNITSTIDLIEGRIISTYEIDEFINRIEIININASSKNDPKSYLINVEAIETFVFMKEKNAKEEKKQVKFTRVITEAYAKDKLVRIYFKNSYGKIIILNTYIKMVLMKGNIGDNVVDTINIVYGGVSYTVKLEDIKSVKLLEDIDFTQIINSIEVAYLIDEFITIRFLHGSVVKTLTGKVTQLNIDDKGKLSAFNLSIGSGCEDNYHIGIWTIIEILPNPVRSTPEIQEETNITFEDITKELTELYNKKNADYGNSFDSSLETIGDVSAITRVYDKIMRLISLNKKDNINFESVEDTWKDIANYAIMMLLNLRTRK